jgi:hypothetical protein
VSEADALDYVLGYVPFYRMRNSHLSLLFAFHKLYCHKRRFLSYPSICTEPVVVQQKFRRVMPHRFESFSPFGCRFPLTDSPLKGPAVISARAVPDPSKLTIKGYLNGSLVQESGLEFVESPLPLASLLVC